MSPYVIPHHVGFLFRQKPIAWFEDEKDYDMFVSAFLSELRPQTMSEGVLVKTIIDTTWEIQRLEKMKLYALEATLPNGMATLLSGEFDRDPLASFAIGESQTTESAQLRAMLGKGKKTGTVVQKFASSHGVPEEHLIYAGAAASQNFNGANTVELARLERRRQQAQRDLMHMRERDEMKDRLSTRANIEDAKAEYIDPNAQKPK